MNKQYIYLVLCLLIVSACTKTDVLSTSKDDDKTALSFSVYAGREITKANVTDVTTSNLSPFKVNGYVKGTAVSYFGEQQTATKSGDYYETGTTFYWPIGQALDFFAYKGAGTGSNVIGNTSGTATIAYAVPSTADDDFVVSKALNSSKPASGGVQALTFSHALAKVNKVTLQAKDNTLSGKYRFTVTELKITGAKNSGTYKFNDGTWSGQSGSAAYEFSATQGSNSAVCYGGTPLVLKVPSSSPEALDQMILLPQTVTFSITYSVEYQGGSSWYTVMASATKTVSLAIASGKAYNITFSLPNDGSKISFSVQAIDSWTTTDSPIDVTT